MDKAQMKWAREEYPREVELVIDDLYDWPTSHLVSELIRWMPKSEFMKMVHQMEDDDG